MSNQQQIRAGIAGVELKLAFVVRAGEAVKHRVAFTNQGYTGIRYRFHIHGILYNSTYREGCLGFRFIYTKNQQYKNEELFHS